MRQLFPDRLDAVDPLEVFGAAERPSSADRPWVMANMVASADGATAVDGVSGSLGGDGDGQVFSALRTMADAILVASGTASAENYGPARTDDRRTAWRRARGKGPAARIAVVTGSLSPDPGLPLFADAGTEEPVIFTVSDAPATRRRLLAERAEIVDVGEDRVDLARALAELGRRGARLVLTEGGPGLLGQLVDAELLDELFLTVAPVLAGGDSRRVVHGAAAQVRKMELAATLEHDGELFLRYVRRDA